MGKKLLRVIKIPKDVADNLLIKYPKYSWGTRVRLEHDKANKLDNFENKINKLGVFMYGNNWKKIKKM